MTDEWKRSASQPIGDRWELRECDGEDDCVVIECYANGVSTPTKDLHIPIHMIGPLMESLDQWINNRD